MYQEIKNLTKTIYLINIEFVEYTGFKFSESYYDLDMENSGDFDSAKNYAKDT